MRGFTLIESIVYMGLYGILIATSLSSFQFLFESAEKYRAQSILQTEATFLASKIIADPRDIRVSNSALVYATSSIITPLSSSVVTVSGVTLIYSTYSIMCQYTLSILSTRGTKISKSFKVVMPVLP